MQWNVYIFLPCLLLKCCLCELGCVNENGHIVDWYILYKLPKNGNKIKFGGTGEEYAILDSVSGKWLLSKKNVSDPLGHLGRTLGQIFKDENVSYLAYNDEDPIGKKVTTKYGHSKGVLAVDNEDGFWLVHSIPKFPAMFANKTFMYPDSGKLHGQSILCISFQNEMLVKILQNFLFTIPYIYSRNYGNGLGYLPEDLKTFFKGNQASISRSPWTYSVNVSSTKGQPFTVFGKHKKWGYDLYDAFVAPNLETSLLTETWRLGSGDPLPSTCGVNYTVINVKRVDLAVDENHIKFENSLDHSKWAVSQLGYKPWVCIGDINRVESQEKRGGGTVCLLLSNAWKAFAKSIVDEESCPMHSF